jgi:2'-hydroxyisoflavone reductase
VKASAELLASSVSQYVFISTISVYRDTSVPLSEESPLRTLENPTTEEMGKNSENFGGGKALCERAAEAAMPGRVTCIRPGFIVGPRDTSGRFIYWPARMSLGGEMIVPGQQEDPIQLIDVRDLADWIVHCLEERVFGIYNATGPGKAIFMKMMLDGVKDGLGSNTLCTWVENSFLEKQNVPEGGFPLYAPPTGEAAGLHRCSITRALGHGLKFRPISVTARDTMEWYRTLPGELQPRIAPQFTEAAGAPRWLEQEKRILESWHARARR